jgi:DNA repair protein SbcD/Mre11
MTTFSFLHAADLHLDTPFEALGAESTALQSALLDASLSCWTSLVELALDREVAFVLLAGDIYDSTRRGLRAQLNFHQGLERLSDAGIQTLIVHGNHDPLTVASSIPVNLSEGVTVFPANRVESVTVKRKRGTIATVHGISYDAPAITENLSAQFEPIDDGGIQIAVLHCNVGSSTEHAPYSPCTVADLCTKGMDYWALGHIHKRAILHAGHPWIVYPGNLQGRSAKPSESGAKGAVIVNVLDNVIQEPEFVELDRIRFVRCEVSIENRASIADLREAISDSIDQLRGQNAGRGILVRVLLVGRGPLHVVLRAEGEVTDFTRTLREGWVGTTPLVWIEAVIDDTATTLDLDAIRARQDFSAEMLAEADRLSVSTTTLDVVLMKDLPTRLRNRLHSLGLGFTPNSTSDLVRAAANQALDLLEEEEAC